MKSLLRSVAAWTLAGCSMLSAQNFNGSDDFSSDVPGNWSGDVVALGGALFVNGGALQFTDGGISGGQTSSAARNWTLNAGSYTSDWQAQVDFTLNLSQVPSQVTTWSLSLASSFDNSDLAQITVQQNYNFPSQRNVSGNFYTNSGAGTPGSAVTGANTVTVRTSFVAASHQISLDYNAGSGFANLTTAVVDGTGLAWGMGSSDTFILNLRAYNVTNSGSTTAITSGVYGDNFVASPTTAIPEPSAYTAFGGLIALAVTMVRRRRISH